MNVRSFEIKWDFEIKDSFAGGFEDGSFTVTPDNKILLAFNTTQDLMNLTGHLAEIGKGYLKELFRYKFLSPPVVDKDGSVYITSKATLLKLGPHFEVTWKYEAEERTSHLPVLFNDSVLLSHFSTNDGIHYIARLDKNGAVEWEKGFHGYLSYKPLVINNELILLGFASLWLKALILLNECGETIRSKNIDIEEGPHGLVRGHGGQIIASLGESLTVFDEDLHELWSYRPTMGIITSAPVIDRQGNIIVFQNGGKIISLNSEGKLNWQADTPGFGYSPLLLSSGLILMATYKHNPNRKGQELHQTNLYLFSNDGEKLSELTLPGFIYHAEEISDHTIFVVTSCKRRLNPNKIEEQSIKIFSLVLQQSG